MRNNSGSYTVKSGYFTTRDRAVKPPLTSATSSYQTNPDLWKHIWHSDTLPKVKQFLWNISQNALPTMDNLHRRKIVPDPLCPICKHEAETIEHTLLLCPWTAQIWTASPLVEYMARPQQVYFRPKAPHPGADRDKRCC